MSDEQDGEFPTFANPEGKPEPDEFDELLQQVASDAIAAGQSPEDVQRLLQATADEHGMHIIPIIADSVDEALAIAREMMLGTRHQATQDIIEWFAYSHLADGFPKETSRIMREVAMSMVSTLPDGPELTTGLRKLLEAKDCFVRQAIKATREGADNPLVSALGDMLTTLQKDTAERRVDDVDLPGDPAAPGEAPVSPDTTTQKDSE